jgi:hypothetical protein
LAVDIAAHAAHGDFFQGRLHRCGQRSHQRIALLDEEQRRAPRRARAKAGQARKQLDQPLDFRARDRFRH